jgi:hypothetical protein
VAEVLGLVEHARQTGALEVRGPEGHGTLYTTAGRFCAGEAADFSGPVETREALDVRLVDVCFHLFRFESGSFEFTANRLPAWEAERGTDIAPIVDQVEQIVREWPAVEAVIPSFDRPFELAHDLADDSVTLSRAGFRVLTLVDGRRSLRQIARELGQSIVAVGPVAKVLVDQGTVRLAPEGGRDQGRRGEGEGAGEGEPDARAAADLLLAPGAVHALRAPDEAGHDGPLVTSVPDPEAHLDRDALERERALLAARAGLDSAGPVPAGEGDAEAGATAEDLDDLRESEETVTSTDRGALLRLFSGLRDQG